ncbi:Hypothetical protein PBC10988_16420 [Planctomycetales bacterium 10988]|nr:Hypothetical protein PBC10988_16420 [Planctomycetales bacterium 10988]
MDSEAEFSSELSLPSRITGGIWRRGRWLLRTVRDRNRPRWPLEACWFWIQANAASNGFPQKPLFDISPNNTQKALLENNEIDWSATGSLIELLWKFGNRAQAKQWADAICEQVQHWNALKDPAITNSLSKSDLSGMFQGLIFLEPHHPQVKRPAEAIGNHLLSWLNQGEAVVPDCLPALAQATKRWKKKKWRTQLDRVLLDYRRMRNWKQWQNHPSRYAGLIATFLDLGEPNIAEEGLQLLYPHPRWDGAVNPVEGRGPVNTAEVAQLIACWLRLGETKKAFHAWKYLLARQQTSGAFPETWSWRQGGSRNPSVWTSLHFLLSTQELVKTTFDLSTDLLPDTILEIDGRWQAIQAWIAPHVRPGLRVAELGCGSGRYLTRLQEAFPKLRLLGIDPAVKMLEKLPRGVKSQKGNLLEIPLPDNHLDAIFTVEALEHALVPQQAIREMCRVLRPGGQLCILDKNQKKQPLSECEPWERWFGDEEVCQWLQQDCKSIEVQAIAHGRHQVATGLFLQWTAVKQ